jgi:protein tyrosine/serine phosphatase
MFKKNKKNQALPLALLLALTCGFSPKTKAAPTVESQSIGLTSVSNARELGGYLGADGQHIRQGVLIRSGKLEYASAKDQARLTNVYNLNQVIDLRKEGEKSKNPDAVIAGATNYGINIYGEKDTSLMTEMIPYMDKPSDNPARGLIEAVNDGIYSPDMYDCFVKIAASRNAYHDFFNLLIANGDGTTLWHCSSGKDRTGIGAVLLLYALGVDKQTIEDDYLLTNDFITKDFTYMLSNAQKITSDAKILATLRKIVGVDKELLDGFYKAVDTEYGSMDNFLHSGIGLTDLDILRLRASYLDYANAIRSGTLNIDGTVAGNVYSVAKGTVQGAGQIQGTLYNLNVAIAGNTTGQGNLSMDGLLSNGRLVVQNNGNTNTQFIVAGTADLTESTIGITNGEMGTPYTVLTAGKITGTALTTPYTGLLSFYPTQTDTVLSLTIKPANNITDPNTTQKAAFAALNNMYEANSDAASRQSLLPAFMLSDSSAGEFLTDLAGEDYSRSAGLVQRNTILHNVLTERSDQWTNQDTANINPENNFWGKFSKNWGDLDSGLANLHGSTMTLGYDKALNTAWRGGGFVSYGKTDYANTGVNLGVDDWRLGFYGNYRQGKHSGFVYLDHGWVKNDMRRQLRGINCDLQGNYNGHLWEVGGEYKQTIAGFKQKDTWQLSPYVNGQLSYYKQNHHTESGSTLYGQQVDDWHNTYAALATGLEVKRSLTPKNNFSFRLGYKRVLTGSDPSLTFRYRGNESHSYTNETNLDKDFLQINAGIDWQLSKKWFLSGQCQLEKGPHSKNLLAGVFCSCRW